ncbi:MAG: Cna B-type domain-containing protein, partial [Acetatifactor sp.]
MKKLLKRILAFTLSVTLMAGMIPEVALARTADPDDTINVSVKIGGVDISSVTQIKQDDPIQIDIDWALAEGDKLPDPGDTEYTYSVELSPMKNVSIPDIADPRDIISGGNVVGKATVIGGVLILKLTDETFLRTDTGRHAGATISGSIDDGGESHGDGEKVPVIIGGINYGEFFWDNGTLPGNLQASKAAAGPAEYVGGKWVQKYTVRFVSWDNKTTIQSVTDVSGAGLTAVGDYTVKTNTGTTLAKGAGETLAGLSDLNGVVLEKDGVIEVEYSMEIQDPEGAFLIEGYQADKFENTLNTTWKNTKNDTPHVSEPKAGISVTKPSVDKTLNAGATDDSQVWTITIRLGDLVKTGKTLNDILNGADPVVEIPGAGLVPVSTLSSSDFVETPAGSGNYVATYETKLSDEYKGYESQSVNNRIEVDTVYGKLTDTENYTTEGIAGSSVTKAVDSFSGGVIKWNITLNNVDKDSQKVYLMDNTNEYYFQESKTLTDHTATGNVWVNGIKVLENGVITAAGASVLSNVDIYGNPVNESTFIGKSTQILFLDSFINSNNGAPIQIQMETKLDDPTLSMKDRIYHNKVYLNYTTKDDQIKSKNAEAVYENTSLPVNVIKKTGEKNEADLAIKYTIALDADSMTYLDSSLGKSIILKDKLPDGMVLDSSFTVQFDDAVLNEWGFVAQRLSEESSTYYTTDPSVLSTAPGFWQHYNPNDPEKTKSVPVSSLRINGTASFDALTGEVTFTIPITENYDIVRSYFAQFWSGKKTQMLVTYQAKIADQEAYDKEGLTKTFTNQAVGEYNGIDLGTPGVDTQSLSPHKMAAKSNSFTPGTLIGIDGVNYNAIPYTIDVNPYAYDLSVGKLVAVDKLCRELSHYLDSIKVYDMTGGVKTELSQGLGDDQYSYRYNASDNAVEFTLPDSKHLQIEYLALVNVYAGTKVGDETLKSFTAVNEFQLSGYTEDNAKAQDSFYATVAKDAYWAVSTNCSIKIRKFWTDEGVFKTVIGSEFAVYKTSYSGGSFVRGDRHSVGSVDSWKVVSESGVVSISGLNYDQIYELAEITAGEYEDPITHEKTFMKVSSTPYYFIVPSSTLDISTIPPEVKIFSSGSYLFFENEEAETIDISVQKVWDDDGNRDGLQASEVIVRLYADGAYTGQYKTLNAGNSWSATFTGLNKKNGELPILYTVDEDSVAGYTKEITGDMSSGYTVTNRHTPEKTSVSVTKVWEDDDNRDGIRPASVTVKLFADGVDTGLSKTLNEGNSWAATFTDLNKKSGGTEIAYTIEEAAVSGYLSDVTGTAASGYTVTNRHTPEKRSIPVEKSWLDDSDRDGIRPASITYRLLANGVEVDSKTVDGTPDWNWTFTDKPVYDHGVAIVYTVKEDVVAGYTTVVDTISSPGIVKVINSHTPEKTSVSVSKVWDDDSNRDGIRPASITVKLYANGTYTGVSKTLNEGNSWAATFTDLNKKSGGTEIAYTIEEAEVTGYTSNVTGTAATGYTVTNSHTPEKTSVSVNKVWDDNGDQDGIRPANVTVKLYADGADTGLSKTLDAGNSWTATFADLNKKSGGVVISYTVVEDPVADYTTNIT